MRKVSISVAKANWFAVVIIVVAGAVLLVPYFLLWPEQFSLSTIDRILTSPRSLRFLIVLLAGIVVHELIHGLTWACYAKKGWRSIRFGVMWKLLTPYCHCSEPLGRRAYTVGGLMPGFLLGVVPAVTALFTGNLPLLLWGVVFIAAASGDIWMVWLLRKEKPGSLILDHPNEAGFYVLEP